MKSLLIVAALSLTSLAVKPANYAGSWTLDKAQSTGLPPYYQDVKAHRLSIKQDEHRIDVDVEVDTGRPVTDKIALSYDLSGVETKTESSIRMQNGQVSVPTTLKADVATDGGVHITITRDIPMGGPQPIHAVTTEDWKLSDDSKTLTVHRVDDTPRGRMEANMVFVRS